MDFQYFAVLFWILRGLSSSFFFFFFLGLEKGGFVFGGGK